MSPRSVNLPPLEIPAPVATPPASSSRRGGESFQDHLRRADAAAPRSATTGNSPRTTDGAATAKRPEPRDDRAEDSQPTERGEEAKVVDRAGKTDTTPSDETKTEHDDGAVAEKTKTDAETEQETGGDDGQTGDAEADAVAAAAAAVAALKEVAVAPQDEVTLSDDVEEPVVAIGDSEHDDGRSATAHDPSAAVKEALAEKQVAAGEAPVDSTQTATLANAAPTATDAATEAHDETTVVADAPKIGAKADLTVGKSTESQDLAPTADGAEPPTETTGVAEAPAAETKSETTDTDGNDLHAGPATHEAIAAVQPVAAATAASVQLTTTQTTSVGDAENNRDDKQTDPKVEAPASGRHQRAEQAATAAERAAAAVDPTRPTLRRDAAVGDHAPAGESSSLSQADRARLVQRVARAVTTAHERGGDLKLRLSPPELGSLRLQVKLADGVLTARLEAETPQARQIIAESLPQLRERLAEQNIRVERFDVDLFQSGGGGLSNMPDQRQDNAHERAPRFAGPTSTASRNAADVATTDVRVNRRGATGLDIVA